MKIQITKYSLLVAALFGISTSVLAQPSSTQGYLIDSQGAVVKSGTGLCWHTGSWTPAMAIAECDPDLVKKEAPPPPKAAEPVVPPVPAPKPVAEKVTLSADTLFDFDKAVLRPEGKAKLDELTAQVKDVKLEVITAVGHADRIGTVKYNQKLSERRAESVKAYLVSKGIEPNRVYTEGKGKSQPVTKPGQCKGNKVTKKLIACLQPDRRVEIEVIGTKEK
ncbi:MAG TPA: OmpA family protein [Rhodocyclaceae bacterium]|nr:OmpA family protein [Rhodocyclaceae bacterium]